MTRLVSTALALLAGAALATPASAEPNRGRVFVETPALASKSVRASLADLESEAGRARVEKLVRAAARAVCDRQHPRESLYQARRSCTSSAVREAMRQAASRAERQRLAGDGPAKQVTVRVSAR